MSYEITQVKLWGFRRAMYAGLLGLMVGTILCGWDVDGGRERTADILFFIMDLGLVTWANVQYKKALENLESAAVAAVVDSGRASVRSAELEE